MMDDNQEKSAPQVRDKDINIDHDKTPIELPNDDDNGNKDPLSLTELTDKNKLFLEYCLAGKKTYESYTLAGYEGTYKSSYELRRRLLPWLAELAGCSQADVFLTLRALESRGIDHTPLSHETALNVAKFKAKLNGMTKDKDNEIKRYSTFIIQRFDNTSKVSEDMNTIKEKALDSETSQEPDSKGP